MSVSLFNNTAKSVSMTVINNTAFPLDPFGNAQTNGNNSSPPRPIYPNSTGSGGIFRGSGGITSVSAYWTPDPNCIWVLFCTTPPNGTQTVKTAFLPSDTMVDQILVQDIQGSAGSGANARHKYTAGGVSVTLESRGTPGRGMMPSPSFYLSYTMAVSVTIINKLNVPLNKASPIASTQTSGNSTNPPTRINANSVGSGGSFEGTDGITAVTVYSTPDPNTVWVLFVSSPEIGTQTIKTAFFPTGTKVDQKLVQDIQGSSYFGPNSSHSYTFGGVSVVLDSHGTPGGGRTQFPSFEINHAVAVGVSITNNLPVALIPADTISNVQTAGKNANPPTTVIASSTGSGGIFRGSSDITAVIAYSTPDPNYLWVLFFHSPSNGPQTVKTAFLPTGTTVDQNLVQYMQGSASIGPNSSHSYTARGVTLILDSCGTPGTDVMLSPTFVIGSRMPFGVTITNSLPVAIYPASQTVNALTVGNNDSPQTPIDANSMGSAGTFPRTDGVPVVTTYSIPDPNYVWVLFFNSQPNGTQTVKTAFFPSGTTVDQRLIEHIQGSNDFGSSSSHSYVSGGASVTLNSLGIPGTGSTVPPSFQINYTMAVSVTITNNLNVPLDPASPVSKAQMNGNIACSPRTVNANSTGSGGIFRGTNGITAITAYSTPDPNYVWVLFFNSPLNGTQAVKTAFFPASTRVDQKLVQDIQDSVNIGPNSSHRYSSGGVSITLDSYATPGRGRTPSPSFQINYWVNYWA